LNLAVEVNDDCSMWMYNVDILLQTIHRSQLMVVEEAGHMVMMEQPEQVNKCLRDFLFTPQLMS